LFTPKTWEAIEKVPTISRDAAKWADENRPPGALWWFFETLQKTDPSLALRVLFGKLPPLERLSDC